MNYSFEWDPVKERVNQRKHDVSFERAATVFRDPNHISIYDDDHSEVEDRWLTLGLDSSGTLTVVMHTYDERGPNDATIRVISARKATRNEARQYEESR
jgi:uncharacterized DUF497 family protein